MADWGKSLGASVWRKGPSWDLNADVLDLLLVNRKLTSDSKSLDFEKASVNIRAADPPHRNEIYTRTDRAAHQVGTPRLDMDETGDVGWTDGEKLIMEEQAILMDSNCSDTKSYQQCVPPHPLTVIDTPALRPSLIHFKWQDPGAIFQRLERNTRPRGYEGKLIKRQLSPKDQDWFEFLAYAIEENIVLRYDNREIEVWKMGKKRNETLFYRKRGAEKIG